MDSIGRGPGGRVPAEGSPSVAPRASQPMPRAPGTSFASGLLVNSGLLRPQEHVPGSAEPKFPFDTLESLDLSGSAGRGASPTGKGTSPTPSQSADRPMEGEMERQPDHEAQPRLGPVMEGSETTAERMKGRVNTTIADRNLLNLIAMHDGSPDMLCRIALEEGPAVSLFEGILNKAHRADDTQKKDAAKFILLMLKAHGEYVYDHCTRLVDLALGLSRYLGVSDDKLDREVEDGLIHRNLGEVAFFLTQQSPRQRYALAAFLAGIDMAQDSLLHDIGKIQVPAEILYKPGAFTEEEFAIMRQHPVWGAEILSQIPPLRHAIPVVRHHHERWDGRGYPDRLYAENSPMAARIVSVVDAFDAMVADRPYRKAMPVAEALKEIREGAGSHFDPNVANGFLAIVNDIWSREGQY